MYAVHNCSSMALSAWVVLIGTSLPSDAVDYGWFLCKTITVKNKAHCNQWMSTPSLFTMVSSQSSTAERSSRGCSTSFAKHAVKQHVTGGYLEADKPLTCSFFSLFRVYIWRKDAAYIYIHLEYTIIVPHVPSSKIMHHSVFTFHIHFSQLLLFIHCFSRYFVA